MEKSGILTFLSDKANRYLSKFCYIRYNEFVKNKYVLDWPKEVSYGSVLDGETFDDHVLTDSFGFWYILIFPLNI